MKVIQLKKKERENRNKETISRKKMGRRKKESIIEGTEKGRKDRKIEEITRKDGTGEAGEKERERIRNE